MKEKSELKEEKFSHISAEGNPRMVDVSEKSSTRRVAQAQTIVHLDQKIIQHITAGEHPDIHTKKGPVFQTAIIAGTMAVKKTSELIPFCHPLMIERCEIDIQRNDAQAVVIRCTVGVSGKTGVEMEALTGATVAALTLYDMCKSLSHNITIQETRLLSKSGGKSGDFQSG